jgi:hypothetical protein
LHRIEVSMFNIWKQLPDLDIVDKIKQQKEETQEEDRNLHIVSIEDLNGVEEIPEEDKKYWHNWIQCNGCKRWWRGQELLNYHNRKSGKTECNNLV